VESVAQRKRAAELKKQRKGQTPTAVHERGRVTDAGAGLKKLVRCEVCGTVNKVSEGDTLFACTNCGQALGCAPELLQPCSADDIEGIPIAPRAKCRPCPTTGEEMDSEDWRKRLMRFYAVKQPEKVAGRQLNQIIRSWTGREDELLLGLIERLGPEPSLAEGDEAVATLLSEVSPPRDHEGVSDVRALMEAQAAEASAKQEPGLRKRFMTFVKPGQKGTRTEDNKTPGELPIEQQAGEVTGDTSKGRPQKAVGKLKAVLKFGGLGGRKSSDVGTPRPKESPRGEKAAHHSHGGAAGGEDGELKNTKSGTMKSEESWCDVVWTSDMPLSPLTDDSAGELRVDEEDGNAYSLSSFIEVYGGTTDEPPEEWCRARPFKGPAVQKK